MERRRSLRRWALLVAWLAGVGCVSLSRYEALELERDGLQTDLEAARQRIGELERRIAQLEEALAAKEAELAGARKELTELRAHNAELAEALRARGEELRSLVARLQQQRNELEARIRELEAERETLAARAEAERKRLEESYRRMTAALEAEVRRGEIQVQRIRGKLRVVVADRIFFRSGEAEVTPEGREVLARVAAVLKRLPEKQVRIEGHTDNVPIGPRLRDRFPTNWHLAAARAVAVVRILQDEGVDPHRLAAISYGPYRPIASNATPEGRARNRRIEVVLQDPEVFFGAVTEPLGAVTATAPATTPEVER